MPHPIDYVALERFDTAISPEMFLPLGTDVNDCIAQVERKSGFMISRKTLAAAGFTAAAAVMLVGPAAANAETGSGTGSAELAGLSSGSADVLSGSAAGSSVLESGSGAVDSATSAVLNIIESVTGLQGLAAPAE